VRDGDATAKHTAAYRDDPEGSLSMTKRGIIEELLNRCEKFSHRESETIVNAIFDAMAAVLGRGERIEIRGFGTFGVKPRGARQGRNPKTGETVAVQAKRIPFFRAGKELRTEVNGAEPPAR
jgi:integration host factor beta subunit